DRLPHQRFEEIARTDPSLPAVAYGTEWITYGELEAWASELARRLQVRGVGPDVVVGICLPRRINIVVAVLAVLKAGAAYLPLDPSYPLDRRRFMLTDEIGRASCRE